MVKKSEVKNDKKESKLLSIFASIFAIALLGCEKIYQLLRYLMPAMMILLAIKVGALPNHWGTSTIGILALIGGVYIFIQHEFL